MEASVASTERGVPHDVVIYHTGCHDGTVAAWAYWRTLPEGVRRDIFVGRLSFCKGKRWCAPGRVLFLSANPDDAVPKEVVSGRRVLILDLALPEEALRGIVKVARSVLVLDHHESEEETTLGLDPSYTVTRDVTRSAAHIAWSHFNAGCTQEGGRDAAREGKDEDGADTPSGTPALVLYVEDRDTWRWLLPDSRAVNEALYTEGLLLTFPGVERVHQEWSLMREVYTRELAERGKLYERYRDNVVRALARNALMGEVRTRSEGGEVATHRVLAVETSILRSEIASHLMETWRGSEGDLPLFAIAWRHELKEGEMHLSLRTTREDVDLSWVSKHVITCEGAPPPSLKGGGHRKASGLSYKGHDIRAVLRLV